VAVLTAAGVSNLEARILQLAYRGHTDAEIGRLCGLSEEAAAEALDTARDKVRAAFPWVADALLEEADTILSSYQNAGKRGKLGTSYTPLVETFTDAAGATHRRAVKKGRLVDGADLAGPRLSRLLGEKVTSDTLRQAAELIPH
jgi:hypothetical protein